MTRTAQLTIALAAGRAAFGAALIGAPAQVGTNWIGADAESRPAQVPIRGLGARDIALAAGAALAATRGGALRPWLVGIVASDLADVASILAAGRTVPGRARIGTLVVAGGSALAGAALTRAVDT